jgi:hypothetical protein
MWKALLVRVTEVRCRTYKKNLFIRPRMDKKTISYKHPRPTNWSCTGHTGSDSGRGRQTVHTSIAVRPFHFVVRVLYTGSETGRASFSPVPPVSCSREMKTKGRVKVNTTTPNPTLLSCSLSFSHPA